MCIFVFLCNYWHIFKSWCHDFSIWFLSWIVHLDGPDIYLQICRIQDLNLRVFFRTSVKWHFKSVTHGRHSNLSLFEHVLIMVLRVFQGLIPNPWFLPCLWIRYLLDLSWICGFGVWKCHDFGVFDTISCHFCHFLSSELFASPFSDAGISDGTLFIAIFTLLLVWLAYEFCTYEHG